MHARFRDWPAPGRLVEADCNGTGRDSFITYAVMLLHIGCASDVSRRLSRHETQRMRRALVLVLIRADGKLTSGVGLYEASYYQPASETYRNELELEYVFLALWGWGYSIVRLFLRRSAVSQDDWSPCVSNLQDVEWYWIFQCTRLWHSLMQHSVLSIGGCIKYQISGIPTADFH